MRHFVRLALLVCCACAGLLAGPAEARRVALVIGNAEYKVGPLANPLNDAAAVAEAFEKQLRFDKVILRRNLDLDGFRAALREMALQSRGAEFGVIYFAGHGIEVAGRNFLVPTDAALAAARDIDLEAIALDTVLGQLDGVSKLKLVILDACRNNPFPVAGARRNVSRGLVRVEPEGNTLIAYAAKDGTTADDGKGRHSPFTAALLKRIVTPGLDVRRVFGYVSDDVLAATNRVQEPYLYGRIGGAEIFLHPQAPASQPAAPPAAAQLSETALTWAAVKDSSSIAALEAFRRQYGAANPVYDRLAQARIDELKKQQITLAVPPAPRPAPAPAISNGISYRVTIPRGLTSYQIVERLKADRNLTGDLAEIPSEGSLLPEAFVVRRGTTRQEIIDTMRAEARNLAERAWAQRRKDLPLRTWEEAVVLASIVEKETGRDDERGRVAAVFVNRLRRNMRLQSDPTILYGIGAGKTVWNTPILKHDLSRKTAYNTYQIDGLPPTPICNPGRASIEAVLNPPTTKDLYFVADGSGGYAFAETLMEHNANVLKWRAREKEMTAKAAPPPPAMPAPAKPAQPAVAALAPSRAAEPLTLAAERALKPGDSFKECDECPEMVAVPAGSFMMGSTSEEEGRKPDEGPRHRVAIARPFAAGRFEVTFAEWDACVAAGGCKHRPDDLGWGRGRRPVIMVSWNDITKEYLPWLSRKTGKTYRLLSEAEWEYAARAGTMGAWSFGGDAAELCEYANHADQSVSHSGKNTSCNDGVGEQTAEVGRYEPNALGLRDMHGNVWEWVQDCWNGNYNGAPADGLGWMTGNCKTRVLRGGSWADNPDYLRSAARYGNSSDLRDRNRGYRVARTLGR